MNVTINGQQAFSKVFSLEVLLTAEEEEELMLARTLNVYNNADATAAIQLQFKGMLTY